MIEHSLNGWILYSAFTVGGGAGLSYFIWSAIEGWTAMRWPTALGEVTSSVVERVPGGKLGPNYEPRLSYWYSVGGVRYTGDRVRFGDNVVSFEATARHRLAPYQTGTSIQVHYDPENPSRSVLSPGVNLRNYAYMVFMGGLFLVGLAALAGIVR